MSELGLYDLRNRFMSSELGRFLQPDPVGLQMAGARLSAQQKAFFPAGQAPETFASTELNLYRYCHNDPINKVDPDGTLAWFIAIPLWMAADWAYDKYAAEHVNNFVDRNFSPETAGNLRDAGNVVDAARTAKNLPKLAARAYREGAKFSKAAKDQVKEANRQKNHGKLRSDQSGQEAQPAQQSQKGVTPPVNEAHVDHVQPRSRGGDNSPENAQILTREENLKKGNR